MTILRRLLSSFRNSSSSNSLLASRTSFVSTMLSWATLNPSRYSSFTLWRSSTFFSMNDSVCVFQRSSSAWKSILHNVYLIRSFCVINSRKISIRNKKYQKSVIHEFHIDSKIKRKYAFKVTYIHTRIYSPRYGSTSLTQR